MRVNVRFILPASLFYSTNNAVVIALIYPLYDDYTESMTFSVMGVYASLPELRKLILNE